MAHTGVHVAIPEGHVGILSVRSSVGAKRGVGFSNDVGIIDSDYRGELGLPLFNHGGSAQHFERGERIAQLVVVPCITDQPVRVAELPETERGEAGFGSTGER